jgi:hypothetical protein
MAADPETIRRINAATDPRMAALRAMYPTPAPITARATHTHDVAFEPNVPIDVRHVLFRQRAPDGKNFTVDPLFPAILQGRADMSGLDEHSADCLYGLVRAIQPLVVLETGTHRGRSTRAIATALQANAEVLIQPHCFTMTFPPGHCYTVDAEDHHLFTSGAIPASAQRYVTPIIGWTPDVFTQPPLGELTGIDFAFLDGDHSAEGLDAELQYVDAHRAAECWVAVDNSRDAPWPGIAQTLREYTKYPRISLPTVTGMDIIHMSGVRSPRAENANGGAR